MHMNKLAIRFLNEEGNPVTQEAVNSLVDEIRNHYCGYAWLALDEYGKEDFPAVYMGFFAKTGKLYPELQWEESEDDLV